MDLERIKQNLRLRSGRNKKPSKKAKAQAPVATTEQTQIQAPKPASNGNPNGHVTTLQAFSDNSKEQDLQQDSTIKPWGSITPLHDLEPDPWPTPIKEAEDSASPPRLNGQADTSSDKQDQQDAKESRSQSKVRSESSPSQKEDTQVPSEDMPDSKLIDTGYASDAEDYDLRPPAPKPKPPSVESVSELLFSTGHLNTLLYSSEYLSPFTAFLRKYRPQDYPLLMRYLETAKAIKAIEYANAVAESAPALPQTVEGNETEVSNTAATFNTAFQESCDSAFRTLVETSLPLYITYTLVRTISECLIDEITGRTTSAMKDMVGGLSEVFCLADPNQKDTPIVYASEEFYRLTGYGRDDVIGHNCRFLQGSKTKQGSTQRLRESLDQGDETCETLLNYRRDGRPFINVLMIAPLHDDKGNLKYYIGAQVDVSRLIESGRSLDSFQKYLLKREAEQTREAKESETSKGSANLKKKAALIKLRELSELFDLEESAVVQSHSRSSSKERDDDSRSIGSGNARRRLYDSHASDDEDEDEQDPSAAQRDWKLGHTGPGGLSGKLPGVYEKYMLIRPAPSLRVVFVSPKLRKFGNVVASPFMSHVAAPAGTLSGLAESFKAGIPVSAKINFMPWRTEERHGTKISPNERHEDGKHGRACWMSATPLLGSDDDIGVWMIVFVEKAQAKARRARANEAQSTGLQDQRAERPSRTEKPDDSSGQRTPGPPGTNTEKKENGDQKLNLPIKPKRLDDAIHLTSRRQDGDRSASAYQYQAATPVEEYHSADESAKSSAKKSSVRPQTPTYGISEGDFVTPIPNSIPSRSPGHVRISPDSDANREGSDRSRSTDTLQSAENSRGEELQDPNNIPPSEPSESSGRGSRSDDEDDQQSLDTTTPPRSKTPEKSEDFGLNSVETIRQQKSPSPSPPPRTPSPDEHVTSSSRPTPMGTKSFRSHATRNSATLPAGLGYMDYLKHSGSNRQAPDDFRRGRRKTRNQGSDGDPFSETDCATSPYSVD